MARQNTAITLTEEDRKLLETWIAAHGTPQLVVLRCRIILLKVDGMDDIGIAQKLHINRHTCRLWRPCMLAEGPSGPWEVAPGRGRKPRAGLAAKVIEATLSTKPKAQTHWSSREMAREQGVHHSTVARVWSEHEIKPHRHKTFKLSSDANFVPKLVDVEYGTEEQLHLVMDNYGTHKHARVQTWLKKHPRFPGLNQSRRRILATTRL